MSIQSATAQKVEAKYFGAKYFGASLRQVPERLKNSEAIGEFCGPGAASHHQKLCFLPPGFTCFLEKISFFLKKTRKKSIFLFFPVYSGYIFRFLLVKSPEGQEYKWHWHCC